jgi:predicted nucleic-acid-binding Zn-ribbon protein
VVKCTQCQGTDFDSGRIKSTFSAVEYLSIENSSLNNKVLDVHLCLSCGHIEIFAPLPGK